MVAAEPGHRSRLPHILGAAYALAIVFASLQPFGDWIAPPDDVPFWLLSPGRVRMPRFDVIANFFAYLPLGAFVALMPRRALPRFRVALGTSVIWEVQKAHHIDSVRVDLVTL